METVGHHMMRDVDVDLIVELTTAMVAIPTQNPPGGEKPCAEFICRTLSGWGIDSELVLEPDPERPQVVARLGGNNDGPTLILNGHMDTVSEGDRAAWRFPPLSATRENGRLYGLGTADMKGSLAIAMVVLKTLKEAGLPTAGSIMFQAVMGEETGEPGTKTLLERGYVGDCAIVLEPTDLRIGPGTSGACWHNVTLRGPSIHCGVAPADVNDVMQVAAEVVTMVTEHHRMVSAQKHHLLGSPGCRVTRIESDGAFNATVGECRMVIDRRMLPKESPASVTEDLSAILDTVTGRYPDISYGIELIKGITGTETSLEEPLIAALRAGYRAATGQEAEIWGPPYGSDMRNFVGDAGIPTTNFGPGDFRVCHQPNEFVEIEDMGICARVIMATALEFLEGKTVDRA